MTDLAGARAKLGAVLAPVADTDPDVLFNLVDSIEPPALMLGWGEPWLEPRTACIYDGRLVVTCVGSRLVPGEGVAQLEALVQYTLDRLHGDTGPWPVETVSGPRVFVLGKTSYLAARVVVTIPIT